MPDRRRFRRGPPPWWPAGEAWPPPPGAWTAMRGRFARRIALLVFVLFALVLATGVLGFLLFGERGPADHGRSGWNGPPIFGYVLIFGAAVFVVRLLRR